MSVVIPHAHRFARQHERAQKIQSFILSNHFLLLSKSTLIVYIFSGIPMSVKHSIYMQIHWDIAYSFIILTINDP